MARLQLSQQRVTEAKKLNIGKVLLFCEGNTEKYYFDYFAQIINSNENKYNNVIVTTEAADGNAQKVLKHSVDFLSQEENNRLFVNYGKYLVFDCDAPEDISSVITQAASHPNNYHLLVSNHLFETWLLMHFEDVEETLSKKETANRLSDHLNAKYKKGQKGRTREIILNGDVEKAIENARKLEKKYDHLGKTIYNSINDMNPYSNVYTLVEQLMLLIS